MMAERKGPIYLYNYLLIEKSGKTQQNTPCVRA